MKILAGAITEYEGEIRLNSRPVVLGPRKAEDAGIRIIYQELNLVPSHGGRQHLPGPGVALGGRLGWLDYRAMEAREAADRRLCLRFHPVPWSAT